MNRLLAIAVALATLIAPAHSYAQARDSLALAERADMAGQAARAERAETLRGGEFIAPGVLMGAGVFATYSPWYRQTVNLPAKDYAASLRDGQYCSADMYIQYLPAVMHAGVGFIAKPSHGFIDRALAQATAWASMGILTNVLKYSLGIERPDGSARNSFPSGHTATAFMGAELVRLEYGPWWGAGAYTVAAATALLRVYNERHWTSDLLGGAAIGLLSAHIGYWLLPLEKRLLGLDRSGFPALAALPYSTGHSAGMMMMIAF